MFYFYLTFQRKVSSFINRYIVLVKWIAITKVSSLRNLIKIWSIAEGLTAFKFLKIFDCAKQKNFNLPIALFLFLFFSFLFKKFDVKVFPVTRLLNLRKTNKNICILLNHKRLHYFVLMFSIAFPFCLWNFKFFKLFSSKFLIVMNNIFKQKFLHFQNFS